MELLRSWVVCLCSALFKILWIELHFVQLEEKRKLFALGPCKSKYDKTFAKHLSEAASGVQCLMIPFSDFHTIDLVFKNYEYSVQSSTSWIWISTKGQNSKERLHLLHTNLLWYFKHRVDNSPTSKRKENNNWRWVPRERNNFITKQVIVV